MGVINGTIESYPLPVVIMNGCVSLYRALWGGLVEGWQKGLVELLYRFIGYINRVYGGYRKSDWEGGGYILGYLLFIPSILRIGWKS